MLSEDVLTERRRRYAERFKIVIRLLYLIPNRIHIHLFILGCKVFNTCLSNVYNQHGKSFVYSSNEDSFVQAELKYLSVITKSMKQSCWNRSFDVGV